MATIEITTLRDSDESLCNIVHAYGGGEGLARMLVLVRDEASIALYGPYPKAVDFPQAADLADLQTLAQGYLTANSQPKQAFEVKAAFPYGQDPALRVGDTVRVVSPRSGLVTATTIEELDLEESAEGVVYTLFLGRDAPSLLDEVLDTVDGEERERAKLGLPAPQIRLRPGKPGLVALVSAIPSNSRATGVEVHLSPTAGFTPDVSTLVARGDATRYDLPNLTPGTRYYARARAYDARGNLSDFSPETSAVARGVDEGALDPNLADKIDDAAAQAAVVAANKQVWDLARLVTQTTLIGGDVTGATANTLSDSAKDFIVLDVQPNMFVRLLSGAGDGQIRVITAVAAHTLTVDPPWDVQPVAGDDYEVSSSARITSREQGSIVATLSREPTDPAQFTAIKQSADKISLTAAIFNPFGIAEDSGAALADENGVVITSEQPAYAEGANADGSFSQLDLTPWSITSIVSKLMGDPKALDQFSVIKQVVDEIDLRVKSGEIVSSINLSPEGVRIRGDKIQLNGDVAVTGNVAVTNAGNAQYRFESRDAAGNLKAALGALAGLTHRGSALPAGSFGLLAPEAYLEVTDAQALIDTSGVNTGGSTQNVWVTAASKSITLARRSVVLIIATADVAIADTINQIRLERGGNTVSGSLRQWFHLLADNTKTIVVPGMTVAVETLNAGTYTYNFQVRYTTAYGGIVRGNIINPSLFVVAMRE